MADSNEPEDPEAGGENGGQDADPDAEEQKSRKKRLQLAIAACLAGVLIIAIIFAQLLRNPAGDTAPVPQDEDKADTLPGAELKIALAALATTDPQILDFGTLAIGETTKTLDMQVTILQNEARVRAKDFTQNADKALRIVQDSCSTFSSIKPNEQCGIRIAWTPDGTDYRELQASEFRMDISAVAQPGTQEYWNPFVHAVPIGGIREKITPPLKVTFPSVRFGTKTMDQIRDLHEEEITLEIEHRNLEIVGVNLAENAPSGADGLQQENDCPGLLVPRESDSKNSCTFKLYWETATPGQVLDATLEVTYRDQDLTKTLSSKVSGSIQLPRGVSAEAVLSGPVNNVVDYGNVTLDPKNKRVTLKNTGLPSVISRVEVYSDLQNVQDSFDVDDSDCTSSGTQRLVHEERCTLILRWSPVVGPPLEDSDTQLNVYYYPDGTASSEIRVQEKNLQLMIQGTPPTSYEIPGTEDIQQGGTGNQTLDPGRVLSPLEEARLSYAFHRAEPVLGSKESGAIGEIQLPPPAKSRIEQLQDQLNIGSFYENDYRSIDILPADGVSSRPVNLTSVVAAGDVIPMTLLQNVDATAPTFVTAVVNSDVYSQHGRNLVIPKGSIVAGKTVPVSLPQNLVAASGLAEDSESTTASPSTSFQGKLFIEWDRIRTPQGVQWRPSELGGQDLMGRTGVPGHYDPKELAIFLQSVTQITGQALVTLALGRDIWRQTTTTADGTTSIDLPSDPGTPRVIGDDTDESADSSTVTVTRISPTTQARTQAIEQITQIIRRQINTGLLPTPSLFVPAGTRMVLRPTEDLWLKPWIGPLATSDPSDRTPAPTVDGEGDSADGPQVGIPSVSTTTPTSEEYEEYLEYRQKNQQKQQQRGNLAGNLLGVGGPDRSSQSRGQPDTIPYNPNDPNVQPTAPGNFRNPSDPANQDYYNPTPGSGGYNLQDVSPFEGYPTE